MHSRLRARVPQNGPTAAFVMCLAIDSAAPHMADSGTLASETREMRDLGLMPGAPRGPIPETGALPDSDALLSRTVARSQSPTSHPGTGPDKSGD